MRCVTDSPHTLTKEQKLDLRTTWTLFVCRYQETNESETYIRTPKGKRLNSYQARLNSSKLLIFNVWDALGFILTVLLQTPELDNQPSSDNLHLAILTV